MNEQWALCTQSAAFLTRPSKKGTTTRNMLICNFATINSGANTMSWHKRARQFDGCVECCEKHFCREFYMKARTSIAFDGISKNVIFSISNSSSCQHRRRLANKKLDEILTISAWKRILLLHSFEQILYFLPAPIKVVLLMSARNYSHTPRTQFRWKLTVFCIAVDNKYHGIRIVLLSTCYLLFFRLKFFVSFSFLA